MTSTQKPTIPVITPKGYRNDRDATIYWVVRRITRRGVHYFQPETGWLDQAEAEAGARWERDHAHKPARVVAIPPGGGFPKRLS